MGPRVFTWFNSARYERYPGDRGEDEAHGHGHGHADAHNEEDADELAAGPVHDFGIHDTHEDSHAGI